MTEILTEKEIEDIRKSSLLEAGLGYVSRKVRRDVRERKIAQLAAQKGYEKKDRVVLSGGVVFLREFFERMEASTIIRTICLEAEIKDFSVV